MKILIFDNNYNDIDSFVANVQKIPLDIEVHTVYELDSGIQLYDENTYDIVFINNSVDSGGRLLLYILENNCIQRIITIASFHTCSMSKECHFCENPYEKERLFKPITQHDILLVLTNKNIQDNCSTGSLIMCLIQIEKQVKESYPYFELDKENLTFMDTYKKPYNRAFFLIIEELNGFGINYKVDEDANIKIVV